MPVIVQSMSPDAVETIFSVSVHGDPATGSAEATGAARAAAASAVDTVSARSQVLICHRRPCESWNREALKTGPYDTPGNPRVASHPSESYTEQHENDADYPDKGWRFHCSPCGRKLLARASPFDSLRGI